MTGRSVGRAMKMLTGSISGTGLSKENYERISNTESTVHTKNILKLFKTGLTEIEFKQKIQ